VGDTAFIRSFRAIVKRLDHVTAMAEALVANNKNDVDEAIGNMHAISVEVRDIIEDNRAHIDTIAGNGARITDEVLSITDQVDSVAVTLRGMLADIENGQGTVGMLIEDEGFSRDLKRSLADVDTLVKEVNKDGLKLRLTFRKKRKW
jgi:ABC-type transporter Mla subunit MlaD